MPDNSTVDYVVVGAGTAGCIVAARLSVDPGVKVALLELGGMDTNPAIYQPGLGPMFSLWDPHGAENWGYSTVTQSGCASRTIDVARGRVVGGSSCLHAKIYVRGNRRDFDTWAAFGNRGWGYADVLPYFRKSETYHGPASEYHGDDGPVSVIDYPDPSPVSHAFVEAAAALGATQKYNDFNAASQEAGAGFYQSTRTLDDVRVSSASAFIHPIMERRNFQLVTQARATRLIIESGAVRGVQYATPDGVRTIRAEREVVLCGGAYETPKLMMLSGIGPAAHLAEFGIAVVHDMPGVGANLQDHMLLGVGYESLIPLDAPQMLAEAGLFHWTRTGPEQISPDLQYFFGPVQFVPDAYRTSNPGFTFAPILAQPLSRGTVSLASADPTVNARLDPQYLSRDEDVAILEYGIRYSRELAHTSAFSRLRGRELAPGDGVTGIAELRDYVRTTASTVWHPVGTCRMGSDAGAVVDDELRVHGLAGLRIADASVMPKLVNGNPNAAIMMIAEKAADLIRLAASPAAGSPPTSVPSVDTGEPAIHQLIFAYPRPGMSEPEFQRYWVEEHAVRYASRIPQIRRYMVDTRLALPGETGDPLWCGVAEIWLQNDREQLESLQTPEFLQGARLDEPNWAAFWRTVVLDTTAHVILPGPPRSRDSTMVKLLILAKRKEGLPLRAFRAACLGPHAAKVKQLPGLRRYVQGHVRDGFYGIGEAVLDVAEQLWFDSVDALLAARRSVQQDVVNASHRLIAEERTIHRMVVQEHWILGPEARPYPAQPGVAAGASS